MRLAQDPDLAAATRTAFIAAALLSLHNLLKLGWLSAAGDFLTMFALLAPAFYLAMRENSRKRRAEADKRLLERESLIP